MKRIKLLDRLVRTGKIVFSIEDAVKLDSSRDRRKTVKFLQALEKEGWIERLYRGKYMIIPLGAEKGKYTEHEFILASSIVQPYAIAYWSALSYWGLTSQIPNTVFIQTTKKSKKLKLLGLDFWIIHTNEMFGLHSGFINETRIWITDREKTLIDCLDKPQYCGGLECIKEGLQDKRIRTSKLYMYAQRLGKQIMLKRLKEYLE